MKNLKEIKIKDSIPSPIPGKCACFLKEQRVGDLKDLEERITAYYDVSKDIFTKCCQPGLNNGAAAKWTYLILIDLKISPIEIYSRQYPPGLELMERCPW